MDYHRPVTPQESRRISLSTGVLFLITFIASIPALWLFQPVLDDPVGYVAGNGDSSQIFLGSLLELRHFIAALPGRLTKLLDATTNAELEIKIRIVDANAMVEGFQKIANRIASGIILAALIVGAALLMRVETTFRIYGYPGLAMLFFIAAAAGGCWLLINIFVQDQRRRRKSPTSIGR